MLRVEGRISSDLSGKKDVPLLTSFSGAGAPRRLPQKMMFQKFGLVPGRVHPPEIPPPQNSSPNSVPNHLTRTFILVYLVRKFVLILSGTEETHMSSMPARKLSRPVEYDVEDDDALYDTRLPTSTRRYKSRPPVNHESDDAHTSTQGTLIQRRRSSLSSRHTTSGIVSDAVAPSRIEPKQRDKRFPLSAVLVGMVFTVVLILALSAFLSWWKVYQDDLHYGRPRTSQIDAVVGHNDSVSNPTH